MNPSLNKYVSFSFDYYCLILGFNLFWLILSQKIGLSNHRFGLSFLSRLFSSFSMRLLSFSVFISIQESIPSVLWQDSGTTFATRIAPPGGKGLLMIWGLQVKLISELLNSSELSYRGAT